MKPKKSPQTPDESVVNSPSRVVNYPFKKNYKVLEEIASGTNCVILKVRQKRTPHRWACKRYVLTTAEIRKNSMREVENLYRFQHPNIIGVYECFRKCREINIVMEYCEGGRILDKLRNSRSLSELQVALYMQDVLSAVKHLHSLGFMHRNLSMNCLLFYEDSEDSLIKIAGFQYAKKLKSSGFSSKLIGKIFFIAPEMIKRKYNEKCDVWSIGVILYVLLSGKPPFTGKNQNRIIKRILNEPVKFNGPEWEQVSKNAIDLVTQLLQKDPKKRPNVSEALNHPWLQNRQDNRLDVAQMPLGSLQHFASFSLQSEVHQATLAFLASHSSQQQELIDIQKMFMYLDINRDGSLSKEELVTGLTKLGLEQSMNVEQILQNFHKDSISFRDFIAVTTEWKTKLNKQQLYKAFRAFDLDGDGTLSLDELKTLIPGDESYILGILESADKDGNGVIDFDEFCEYILSGKNQTILKRA